MSPEMTRAAIARNVTPPAPGSAPYARPAKARAALIYRCHSCGDYILPSELRAFRAQSRDPLAAPETCWNCAEVEKTDKRLMRGAR